MDIPMDVLTPGGECSIGLYEETPPWYPDDDVKYYAWTQFDYYRLEIRGNRKGSILMFR